MSRAKRLPLQAGLKLGLQRGSYNLLIIFSVHNSTNLKMLIKEIFKLNHTSTFRPAAPLLVVTLINIRIMELRRFAAIKKDVGVKFLSAPIPKIRPSHCPQVRISNVKPAHVEWYINTLRPEHIPIFYIRQDAPHPWGYTLFIYIKEKSGAGNIKLTHANVSCCITAVDRFKFARFDLHRQVTFRKRPFETGPTNGLVSLPSMLFTYARPLLDRLIRVQR